MINDTYTIVPDLSQNSNDGGTEEQIAKSAAVQPAAEPGDLTSEVKWDPFGDCSIAGDLSGSDVNAVKRASSTGINRPFGEQVGSAGTSSAVVPQNAEQKNPSLSATASSPASGFDRVENLFEKPGSDLSQQGLVDLNFTPTAFSVSQDSNIENKATNVSSVSEVTGVENLLTEIKLDD